MNKGLRIKSNCLSRSSHLVFSNSKGHLLQMKLLLALRLPWKISTNELKQLRRRSRTVFGTFGGFGLGSASPDPSPVLENDMGDTPPPAPQSEPVERRPRAKVQSAPAPAASQPERRMAARFGADEDFTQEDYTQQHD